MSRVFISHASEDKQSRVKPLVRALAHEGLPIWLDRPGHGESHFGFDPAYLHRHGIEGLRAGQPFDRQILEAHWNAGAVLGCLSRSLAAHRQVLVQELVLAAYAGKLVTCVIDDLPFNEVPAELGLIDGTRLQSPRLDIAAIGDAVDLLEADPALRVADLAVRLRDAWFGVTSLIEDIDRILHKRGMPRLAAEQMQALRGSLASVPIGPMVRPFELPYSIVRNFGTRLHDGEAAWVHIANAMQLVLACNAEGFEPEQIVITRGEVIPMTGNTPEAFWHHALTCAGVKSRRSLAALLAIPSAPQENEVSVHVGEELAHFKAWLRDPALPRTPH